MKHPIFSLKTLAGIAFAASGIVLCAPPALADTVAKPLLKKHVKKVALQSEEVEHDSNEPDVRALAPANYRCELGNTLTVYKNAGDMNNIALRWKTHLHRLNRVSTTTGADRYENVANGLVLIVIPSKAMLLDGKHARQLANECKVTQPTAAVATGDVKG
jgi:hypothetical protein